MAATVRRLLPADTDAYVALRHAMLRDTPLAFFSSPDDDRASDPAFVRARLAEWPDNATFGAFDGDALVGAVGVLREARRKAAHRAHVWGMYVEPGHRGGGLGRALMDAAVAHARALPGVTRVDLSVSDATPAARRLYEAVGFRVWGTEPGAMAWEGASPDEHHLILWLAPRPAAPPLAWETVRTGTVRVDLPPDDALPLFTAVGETLWVPGWSPTYVSPPDGAPVEGGIWLTRDGEQEVIWRVQRYDAVRRRAEYLRVVPGNRVVVVAVACDPEAGGTRATVTYRVTPIAPEGHAWLAGFTEDAYGAMLREWERLIARYAGRSTP